MRIYQSRLATSSLLLATVLLGCNADLNSGTSPLADPAIAPDRSVLAATTSRPLSDFLDQQGTYCISDGMGGCVIFVPPIPNFVGWSAPATNRGISVDYAGLANEWIEEESGGAVSFGTTFSGSITERPLKDGRAEVHVTLFTHNALVWAIEGSDYANSPLLFGYRPMDVLNTGAPPALGDSHLQLKFINPAPGAPLPDFEELFFARITDIVFISMHATADGNLRSASGYPDGTAGKVVLLETAPIGTAFRNGFKGALGDAFPAETINLRPVGP